MYSYKLNVIEVLAVALATVSNVPAQNLPQITGIANAASYANSESVGISPGEIIAIFGEGLGPSSLAYMRLDNSGRVATQLANVMVRFDGIPAPLVYVSSRQIAAIAPYALANKPLTIVEIEYDGRKSTSFTSKSLYPVAATQPGVFTADARGSGQAAALNQDGRPNTPSQ